MFADPQNSKMKPVVVTTTNMQEYSIHDLVLPVPGYDVNYPEPLLTSYQELLAKDGFDFDSFKHKVKWVYKLSHKC